MMLEILERYGTPPKLRSAIVWMYTDIKIVLKIRKAKAEMGQKVGVKQGDCMATVLLFIYDHGVSRNTRDKLETIGPQDDHI